MPTKNTLTEQRRERAIARGDKEPEPKFGLAAYMRGLDFNHPDRLAYLKATKPGAPAGSAPRTIAELQALTATPTPSKRRR
ncbi:hypothetical protein [Hymenobacter fodinae]|uniref:Uncharacterized protein n=1 Tax=Hymenobacter fodinae TaxID=2510796 RepID=A0A4Z0P5E5_9BACT|nr:hypothetical protein [Hymenobacter fodinae]TGE05597.1 hypothetical protein EU556_20055 [Hymenobacter fodinae]